ncbi:metallophosphoesterase [Colwellia sp. MEBiC06753]
MNLVVLHLSDIHIKSETDPILREHSKIAQTLYSHINDDSHVVILISGDIAFSGSAPQYLLAETFLRNIESNLKEERDVPVKFVLCPGNHDCDFSSNPMREFTIKSLQSDNIEAVDLEVLSGCTSHQNEYFEFCSKFENSYIERDRLWSTQELNVGDKKVVFEAVNLSWASNLKEQQGNLMFPFAVYSEKAKLSADLRFSVLHHPLNWLNQSSYRSFRTNLRSISDYVITGHEHLSNAINHDDVESGETIIIEGGVLQEGSSMLSSTLGIITVDLRENINSYFTFEYCSDDQIYKPIHEKQLLRTANSCQNSFRFNQNYKTKLEDCGGYFKHSNVANLKLSDIFIYPNIKKETRQKNKPASISSKRLLNVKKFPKGIVLSSEEKIGSTSLLYTLVSEYSAQGLLPVLIRGSSIKQKTEHNINLQIERALNAQFDSSDIINKFNQEPTHKKVLLIDDFHEIKIKSEKARDEVLAYLMSKFHKVIITVDSMYEIGELASQDDTSTSKLFEHYKIENFGFVKRTELIRKWYSIGQQDNESEAEIIAKCNKAEKLMDTVMDKSLISPHPIYLLTFLQSIETGQSGQLTDSALGHYYSYLLNQGFLDVGISADAIGIELDYAMHLARHFNLQNTFIITKEDFKEFNQNYSDTWHEKEFAKQEQILVKAKVLMKNGDDYEFRYLYNYYYLLGRYLSQHILETPVQKEIANYIEHLYVKKYANTILFLAHHTASDNILVLMKEAADKLFEDNIAADFNGGCTVANDLIQHAPSLEFNKKTPHENRQELSKKKEIVEQRNPDNFLKDEEEDPSNLNLATRLTMLFKTVDILSQIIKSNPTKFQRPKKVEILKSIFSAPLRALQDFYNFLEKHPNALIETINFDLASKSNKLSQEERETIARQAVSRVIQGVSGSFIIKTAQIVNSEVLQPDVPKAVQDNNTLAFELIDLAISLDNHKPIQRSKVKYLFDKTEENMVARKAFDVIILNRLHMFKPYEQDMVWLESELKYNLDQQHKIGYSKQHKVSRLTHKR